MDQAKLAKMQQSVRIGEFFSALMCSCVITCYSCSFQALPNTDDVHNIGYVISKSIIFPNPAATFRIMLLYPGYYYDLSLETSLQFTANRLSLAQRKRHPETESQESPQDIRHRRQKAANLIEEAQRPTHPSNRRSQHVQRRRQRHPFRCSQR